ncbi:MAG: helix-turn-helix domain-containing protein [Emcibacter sp.]|nr:helix-turn-helix domain-containing protein [Emcibacter sp.]
MMLSKALRLLRVYHDLKQKDLAEMLGLSKSHISEIEGGHKTPSLEVIEKYAKLFKVPVSSIIFFAEQVKNSDDTITVEKRAKTAIASKIISFLKAVEVRTEAKDV